MSLPIGKVVANKGVSRNKKPLQNIVYSIETFERSAVSSMQDDARFENYKFKDNTVATLSWGFEKDHNKNRSLNWHGLIKPDELKKLLGDKQWSKFCQGKREFISQRRIDGKNISKIQKNK